MKFENKKLQLIRDLVNEGYGGTKTTVFNEEPAPMTIEEKKMFSESLKTFSQLGESIYSERKLAEAVDQIERMVEMAQRLVNEDSNDVVEATSAGRHFNSMAAALKELKKSCSEIVLHERKASQCYEDIAEGLQKYYSI
tara:strand:- start:270 stop:686 length:417 start_codon:yes stop_codon:yes gene_type:complete